MVWISDRVKTIIFVKKSTDPYTKQLLSCGLQFFGALSNKVVDAQ